MDDVLVDFSGGLKKFNIINNSQFIHKPKNEWTALQIELDKQVQDCMNTPGFFRDLPMNKGADKLWVKAANPYILTAWPKTTKDRDRVGREKREWIEDKFGAIPENRFIYCSREDKAKYAIKYTGEVSPLFNRNILVDDMIDNCEAWERSGGIAILFKHMEQACSDLKKVLVNK